MQDLEIYFNQARAFKVKREQAADKLVEVERHYTTEAQKIAQKYQAMHRSNDSWAESQISQLYDETNARRMSYLKTKELLDDYPQQAAQFCGEMPVFTYSPQPDKVNEQILADLMRMISEDGLLAWIKRTFRLGGYRSRKELARRLCEHVRDAQAYCDVQIAKLNENLASKKQNLEVAKHRKSREIDDEEIRERNELNCRKEVELADARDRLNQCTVSSELVKFRTDLLRENEIAKQVYGEWGTYVPSNEIPGKILLGSMMLKLIDKTGNEVPERIPCWLPLNRSNIVILTSDRTGQNISGVTDDSRKQLVRQILARMLKTIHIKQNRISVFDTLHKGGSLDRLIGVSNVGSAKLSVDVFCEESECEQRRNYLCTQIANIRRLLEGRCDLYEYQNQKKQENEIPFNWVIEFDVPDKLKENTLQQYKVLFTNAIYCGFSFIFETSSSGMQSIKALAQECGNTNIVHVDMDRLMYQGQYPFQLSQEPSATQLDNFMDAISRYFEGSDHLDNKLLTYYKNHDTRILDASDGIKIPVALDDQGKPAFFELSNSTSVHAFITGATRSGKTTLLHSVIMGATLQYSPDDLELWLVDYKQIEFAIYHKLKPPHVKLIGLSKTKDFTFSLLDTLQEEFDRRSECFQLFHVTTLGAYRKHAGEPGYVHFPRIFLIIDEFHEMSQFVQEDGHYKTVLENAMAEYGALGLNCLLSDQAISVGLQGLTPKAKMQIGLRLSMRHNDSNEVKDTLNVDQALYSEAVKHMIHRMVAGDVIMKRYSYIGDMIADISLEKFKGFNSNQEDREALYPLLRRYYSDKCAPKKLIYICSKEQVPWDEEDRIACDEIEPLHDRNLRLYLGRPTTLRPCFAVDLHRKLNENLCVCGGSVEQRWDVIAASINSCRYKSNTKVKVFVCEDSDIAVSLGRKISELCARLQNVQLYTTVEQWCDELVRMEDLVNRKTYERDYLCVFIGMEVMRLDMERMPARSMGNQSASQSAFASGFGNPFGGSAFAPKPEPVVPDVQSEFNAIPNIQNLFTFGSRVGIRCLLETSVYRELRHLFRVEEYCAHRIAFKMSEDDASSYLGRSAFATQIGRFGVYYNGGNTVEQLIPYRAD